MKLYPTIGLEIHAELLTNSKVFCTCSAEFGGEPNSRCCPVCSGLPGTLPVLNSKAVEYIIKAGYIMNCEISRFTKWDRKNYFYPDLPKAYQISQMPRPVCLGGHVDVTVDGEQKTMRINRIHLEEDAGKLVHDDIERVSLADYNRCGIPLIEIVTEPDFHSAAEVIAFFEKIRLMLQYAGVCDGKLEQGSMRCDVNISLAEKDSDKLGTRTEVKNLNSTKAIQRAIEYEIYRQTELIENGERVVQETLHFNDATGETSSLRSKEDAQDYRYFPEPDLVPIVISDEWIAEIKARQPELRTEKLERYKKEFGLPDYDAEIITGHKKFADLFEATTEICKKPKKVSNWIMGEIIRLLKENEMDPEDIQFSPVNLAKVIDLADSGAINSTVAKEVFEEVFKHDIDPDKYVEEKGLKTVNDAGELQTVVEQVIRDNPQSVEDYRNGKEKAIGFLVGQTMKAMKGKANPGMVNKILKELL